MYETYEDFLLSLDMNAEILPFEDNHLPRITQLIKKTNQFNLTTKRLTEKELGKLKDSSNHLHLYGRLSDKFGDNGLISVMAGEIKETELTIDLWLMSCRVLNRNMKRYMFDEMVKQCKKQQIKTIRGVYLPTPKNKLVAKLYADLGFTKEDDQNWILSVDDHKFKRVGNSILERP